MPGILCKPGFTQEGDPPPPSVARQAQVEQLLHLKPGELSPARVKFRHALRLYEEAEEIKARESAEHSEGEV